MICLRIMKKFIDFVFEENSINRKISFNENKTDLAHSILGVPQHTTSKEIKRAYISLMKAYHPDNYTTANTIIQSKMSEKTKLINWAYCELKKKVV